MFIFVSFARGESRKIEQKKFSSRRRFFIQSENKSEQNVDKSTPSFDFTGKIFDFSSRFCCSRSFSWKSIFPSVKDNFHPDFNRSKVERNVDRRIADFKWKDFIRFSHQTCSEERRTSANTRIDWCRRLFFSFSFVWFLERQTMIRRSFAEKSTKLIETSIKWKTIHFFLFTKWIVWIVKLISFVSKPRPEIRSISLIVAQIRWLTKTPIPPK